MNGEQLWCVCSVQSVDGSLSKLAKHFRKTESERRGDVSSEVCSYKIAICKFKSIHYFLRLPPFPLPALAVSLISLYYNLSFTIDFFRSTDFSSVQSATALCWGTFSDSSKKSCLSSLSAVGWELGSIESITHHQVSFASSGALRTSLVPLKKVIMKKELCGN